ncbi:MAG: cupredoxin domain-containing protein [Vicinamibacterales bacterium]
MSWRQLSVMSAITLAVAFAASCSDSASPTAPSGGGGGGGAAADLTITIVGQSGSQSYSPNPATIRAGQRVAWRNADSTAHTATADGGAFNTGIIAPGATSAPITIGSTGSFAYHCTLHPDMVATLTVNP